MAGCRRRRNTTQEEDQTLIPLQDFHSSINRAIAVPVDAGCSPSSSKSAAGICQYSGKHLSEELDRVRIKRTGCPHVRIVSRTKRFCQFEPAGNVSHLEPLLKCVQSQVQLTDLLPIARSFGNSKSP